MGPCNQYNGIDVQKRRAALAERVADGESIHDAGRALGLTRGQTANVWRGILKDCGAQAV